MQSLFWVTLYLQIFRSHTMADELTEFGAALLDTEFMPMSLLKVPNKVSPQPIIPSTNGSIDLALSTMGFHRRMMNEFLCRGYEARSIIEEIERDSQINNKQLQERTLKEESMISQMIMKDQGSKGYNSWLRRSTILQDLYHQMENNKKGDNGAFDYVDREDDADDESGDEEDAEDEEIRVVEEERKKNQQQKGQQKGSRGRSKPKGSKAKKRPTSTTTKEPPLLLDNEPASQNERDPEYAEYPDSLPHSEVVYTSDWTALGFNAKDLFDITLTALAFLAFGLFILNVFLNIITQRVGPQSVMFVTNSTTPSLPVQKREIDWTKEGLPLERVVRWAQEPVKLKNEYQEEKMAKFALYSLNVALNLKSDNCMHYPLCLGNKMSRELNGQAKYWIPIWSLGMSWIVRRTAEEGDSASLFSGALGNVRAAALGVAGVRCAELFPPC